MNEQDYAVVIGISRYPYLEHSKIVPLSVRSFVGWLRDPERGGLPADNITLVVSDNEQGVTAEAIEHAVERLLKQSGRRLYLYVAGRSAFGDHDEIAVLFSDATAERPSGFNPRQLALKIKRGAFKEIVLVVDGESSAIHKVSLHEERTLPMEVRANFFEVVHQSNRQPGFLTRALVEALAPAYDAVTSDSLELRVAEIFRASMEDQPTFASFSGPIRFFDALPLEERVSAQSDDPARIDALQRRAFAEVIGTRMQEVWDARGEIAADRGAFMVHIHGPWGSGKSTVLNLLRAFLQEETRDDRWVVIDFNAWKQQRLKPPWWALINQVYEQARGQLGFFHSLPMKLEWLWWRARADWFPLLTASILLLLAVLAAVVFESATVITIIVTILAAGAAVVTFSRTLIFGSARAAQAYTELRDDPLSPIFKLFRRLVGAIRRPVAIFIDDLDRCDSAYVVELLEGIQTLFQRRRDVCRGRRSQVDLPQLRQDV